MRSLSVVALAFSAGCGGVRPSPHGAGPAATAKPSAAASANPIAVTLLYTSDEHGWLAPNAGRKTRHGGVAQLLHQLVSREQHCAGALPGAPLPDCRGSSTLLLSGGDNYTGPSISGYYRGHSMAVALRRLGYAATAFGNHELDFGLAAFEHNRSTAEVPYLAANIRRVAADAPQLAEPYRIVERAGARIGVVGVSTVETPKAAAAHRFRGVVFDDIEATLDRVIPQLWGQDVDAVVLLAHECHEVIAPLVERNPEWELSFVGTGHCHRTSMELAGDVPVIGPSWRLEHYGRIRLHIHKQRPAKDRAEVESYELVEVVNDAAKPAPSSDPKLDQAIAGWRTEVDAKLGEVIGHSAAGIAKRSPLLGRWIARAWRERLSVDVAITT
jgi:2',3'-cyclic-nucleotide 2'-phosphodiesterase (5'-nucleotidase family)